MLEKAGCLDETVAKKMSRAIGHAILRENLGMGSPVGDDRGGPGEAVVLDRIRVGKLHCACCNVGSVRMRGAPKRSLPLVIAVVACICDV